MLFTLYSDMDPSGDAAARLVGTEQDEKEEEKVFSVRLRPCKGTFTRTKTDEKK